MRLYLYLAGYVAGFIAMFTLLIRGDKHHELEPDLLETSIASGLWPILTIAIICIHIYIKVTKSNRFKNK